MEQTVSEARLDAVICLLETLADEVERIPVDDMRAKQKTRSIGRIIANARALIKSFRETA